MDFRTHQQIEEGKNKQYSVKDLAVFHKPQLCLRCDVVFNGIHHLK
jgi:hypothetical protein